MPNLNLGAGVPNNVNLSYTPTWLFTPSTYATNTVRLTNVGRNIVYVGQANVTTTTGLPILPGSKPIEITGVLTSLYGISTVQQGTLLGTVSSSATAGSTQFTFSAAGVVSALPVGTQFIIGSTSSTSNQEVLNVASSVSTTVLTTTTGAVFAHDTTNIAYGCTPTYGQLTVAAGVI
jgi:hypothetical protein